VPAQSAPAPEAAPPAPAPSGTPVDEQLPPVDEQPDAPAEEPAETYQSPHADASGEIAAANAAAAALEVVEQIWPDVVRDVRVHNKTTQALLKSGVIPVDIQDTVVVLEVESDFVLTKLDQPQNRILIERVLSKHMGANYTIRCVVKEQSRNNPHQLREQIRTNRKDPLIRAAINIFDADIVAVEPNEGE
jgi:DNA polymerase-3 subunit gamma/tau